MQNIINTEYPLALQALRKGQVTPVLAVTQLDENSFKVDLPSGRQQGLAANFYSKKRFLEQYEVVDTK